MLFAILRWIRKGNSPSRGERPEADWVVLHVDGLIVVRPPTGLVERVSLSSLKAVYVETNDSGPWGIDAWWILEGRDSTCVFPVGATGEEEVLAELRKLPGFEVRGMNSTENRRFLCWRAVES